MNQNIVVKEQRFIGYYYILFLFLIVANVSGMVPYSLTLTSYLIITLFFSLTTFLGIVIVGESTNGNHAFHKTKLPMYVPLPIAKLLVAIEFLSYVARVFSLSIRLFANMMAGHTLLKILIGFV
jgi:ATP synthase subunit 6